MKLLFLFATLLPLGAETLSQGERDRAMSHLQATRKLYVDATAGLSEVQWKFKSAPDRWSVAECAEHLAESEEFLRGLILSTLKNSPVNDTKREAARPNRDKMDQMMAVMVADRSKKAQAPEPLKPTGKFSSQEQVVKAFRDRRDSTIAFVEQTTEDLRGRTFSAGGSEMDLYQMAFIISGHTERHVKQMREVIADPNFPKQ